MPIRGESALISQASDPSQYYGDDTLSVLLLSPHVRRGAGTVAKISRNFVRNRTFHRHANNQFKVSRTAVIGNAPTLWKDIACSEMQRRRPC